MNRASVSSQDSVNLEEILGSQFSPSMELSPGLTPVPNVNFETESETQEGEDAMEADIQDDEPQEEANLFGKKQRKKTSFVWKEFEVQGKVAKCIHCKTPITLNDQGTTTSMKNHLLRTCKVRKHGSKKQKILNFPHANSEVEAPTTSSIAYDHPKQREAVAHWVLATNQSVRVVEDPTFTNMLSVNLPFYQRISRTREKDDCMKIYHMEKVKLKKLLKSVETISLTTDLWKSMSQKKSYMCITGHWVDRNWKLQKRVLSFWYLKPPHQGYDIAAALKESCEDWGIEGKVYSISLDNATNNDVAIRLLKTSFWKERHLALGGMLFHVRCCAHILNLVVKDGTKVLSPMIQLVHKTIKWIQKSEARIQKFSRILQFLGLPDHKLIKEVKHRWNSTYEMLVSAMKVKDAFQMLAVQDSEYENCPSESDWVILEKVMKFLDVFYKATKVISATDYPTANRFLIVIWRVKQVLTETAAAEDPDLAEMVNKMREKFDKYWGECNMLMSLGAVMDPRYKMVLVRFCFSKIYDVESAKRGTETIEKAVKDLYKEYSESEAVSKEKGGTSGNMVSTSSVSSAAAKNDIMAEVEIEFQDFVNSSTTIAKTTELDGYLAEAILQPTGEDFDALSWWKESESKYPVLSKMARDILAIPITSVASESTFSTSGRVLDVYRSSLAVETVEALVCGGDWVRKMHGRPKQVEELELDEDNLEVEPILLDDEEDIDEEEEEEEEEDDS